MEGEGLNAKSLNEALIKEDEVNFDNSCFS